MFGRRKIARLEKRVEALEKALATGEIDWRHHYGDRDLFNAKDAMNRIAETERALGIQRSSFSSYFSYKLPYTEPLEAKGVFARFQELYDFLEVARKTSPTKPEETKLIKAAQ